MQKQAKHDIAASTAIAQVNKVSRTIDEVRNVLQFMERWNDEDLQMYRYMNERLGQCMGAIATIDNQIEKLREYADPTAPKDLPF